MMTQEKNEMLTVQEVAKKLRVSPKTVYRLVERGELIAVRVGGSGHLRILPEDFKAFIEQNKTADES
jgi:excisionase family DNA binding protein